MPVLKKVFSIVTFNKFALCFFVGILTGNDETNDLLLAQMLQLEFDKEYDDFVKSKEKVFNQNSNGVLLYILLIFDFIS